MTNTKTKKQIENLTKLADFLERVVPPPKFDIRNYLSSGNGYSIDLDDATSEVYNTCGTSACAAGHGPLAGIRKLKSDDGWDGYCRRVFGADPYSDDGEWHWMFSNRWANRDNTPEGAAARIKWYLAYGVPNSYFDQIHGIIPLCYTDLIVRNVKEPVYIMETPKKD